MRSVAAFIAVAVAAVGACGDDPASSGGGAYVYSTTLKTGIATFYAADGSGSCSYDASPDDLDVVALDPDEYAASAACGACIHVTGPKGEVTVRVTDSCPGCENGHLDLSREAFAKIADPKAGRVSISYQSMPCEVDGNVVYHFKDGSSKYWTAIQVRNHRIPVAKLAYRKNGAYVDMKRANYNYFVASDGVGDQPSGLAVRITAVDGQTLEDTLPGKIPSDESVDGSGQFR